MNVYTFADKLLERISDNTIKLDKLEIDDETFKDIRKMLIQSKLLPCYEKLNLLKTEKSNEIAFKCRLKGNELFKDRKYFSALYSYNESLCFSEASTESLGLSFANRSAVYLEIGENDHCVENINLAKAFDYPECQRSKLEARLERCSAKRGQKKIYRHPLSVSLKTNSQYPFIADCLHLKRSVQFGRHIITDKTLKTGEIIAIERPFSALLLPHHTQTRCTNCLGGFQMNLLPCSGCTHGMMNIVV